MSALFATVALAAPLVLAGEQDFFHMPAAEEVRMQPISRAPNETGWPFSVDDGLLLCVWSTGRKVAMFFEDRPEELDDDEDFEPRSVFLSADPFELTIMNIAGRALFAPAASVEELIVRVAPFAALGQRLCDQPPGAEIQEGEL